MLNTTALKKYKNDFYFFSVRMVYDLDEVDFCSSSDPKILFIVRTNVKDQEKRKTVRETWYVAISHVRFNMTN